MATGAVVQKQICYDKYTVILKFYKNNDSKDFVAKIVVNIATGRMW